MSVHIRYANEPDSALILDFIKELAAYEGMGELVTATPETVRVSVFEKKQAEVLITEVNGEPAAFALFYPVYSTFLGKANLFLEDLFVREEYRGTGIGRKLLKRLAEIAAESGSERLDWYVLKDNEKGAAFYRHLGAIPLNDRRTYRLEGKKLKQLAEGGH